ncbi:TraI/MobA(P) family conjugative relaxase [Novosphingobium terrae]|uniref:TraI/MobA(P) family conjugative relaxase n=1 Tax=Novosphingobium terrae TaxID=2726189 RepID=UPI0019805E02|nr:TraI/MobA(P) family conjugative relaxase [Novosphingobium terrae]
MIAKHVPMRTARLSAFSKLVDYISNSQGRQERVGEVTITNCHSGNVADACMEVEALQASQIRSKGDKTYHLIVSFPVGESPAPEVLKAVEAEICAALGFSDHQRISAVHHDTDNLHIHLAINKVHPVSGNVLSPYNDYKTLAKTCERLEVQFGLQLVNHQRLRPTGEGRANDMEAMAGVESLISWVRQTCVEEMRGAQSWTEIHTILGHHGLEVQSRANGLIIVSKEDGTCIKASSASRDLSKAALEGRLGQFQRDPSAVTVPKAVYAQRPVRTKIDTSALFQRYRDAMNANQGGRKEAMDTAKVKRGHAHEQITKAVRAQRDKIKTIKSPILRKLSFAAINFAQRNARDAVRVAYEYERKRIDGAYRKTAWLDWLKGQAETGNAEALAALRGRRERGPTQREGLSGMGAAAFVGARVDAVTRSGTIIYANDGAAVRDEGKLLHVSRGADDKAILMALEIARQRFGDTLKVEGNSQFQGRVAALAQGLGISVNLTKSKDENERGKDIRSASGRSGGGSQSDANATRGPAGGDRVDRGAYDAWRTGDGRGRSSGRGAWTHLAEVGREPPPQARNRVRHLSELNVARFERRTSMLLPRDVRHDLDQRGRGADRDVRRPVHNLSTDQNLTAATDKYVAEREAKRQSGFSVAKHRPYNGEVGSAEYAGRRTIDGVNLLLLRQKEEIMVLPVNAKTAARVARLSIGTEIELGEGGKIITKGRGR